MSQQETYFGQSGIRDYLTPSYERMLPLVELPERLNPYSHEGVRIFAKILSTLPLGNVKSLPAFNMLDKSKNELTGKVLYEASSGNTVLSLGLLAASFGVEKVVAVASPEVSSQKLRLLRLCGIDARVVKGAICPDPQDPESAIHQAKKFAFENNGINLGQYDNENNPAAHELITGPQIYNQLPCIDVFAAGLGTAGSFYGTSKFLKSQNPNIMALAIVRSPNNTVPGVRTERLMQEIAFDWKSVTDEIVTIGTETSYKTSLDLIQSGLLVGPSSGFALAGLLKFLAERDTKTPLNCVFLCPDSPLPYVDQYFEVLPHHLFGTVDGKISEPQLKGADVTAEVTPDDLFEIVAKQSSNNAYILIDVRTPDEFNDHHIENSYNVPIESGMYEKLRVLDIRGKTCVCICKSGARSAKAVNALSLLGIKAVSLQGGTTAWSEKGFRRVTPEVCRVTL